MKRLIAISLIVLALFIGILSPVVGIGQVVAEDFMVLLPTSAVVLPSNAPVLDKAVAGLLGLFYGDRIGVCDGVTDNDTIYKAAVASHQVSLREGAFNFNSASNLYLPEKTVLSGAGTNLTFFTCNETRYIILKYNDIEIRDLTLVGGFGVQKVDSNGGGIYRVNNLGSASISTTAYAFGVMGVVDNFQHEDVRVINHCGTGFINSGTISNYSNINGFVTGSGRYSRYNDWVVGVDIIESGSLTNAYYVNVRSEYNWESGFHSEEAPIKTNVNLVSCVGDFNGLKPNSLFGSGYVLFGNINAIDCSGSYNARKAFDCMGVGGSLVRPTGIGSTYGAHIVMASKWTINNPLVHDCAIGFYFITGSTKNTVVNPIVYSCLVNIYFNGSNFNNIVGGQASLAGQYNLQFEYSNDNVVDMLMVSEASQTTNNTYSNVRIGYGCSRNTISVVARKGNLPNQPKYGVDIVSGSSWDNRILDSDLTNSGLLGVINDNGTNTVVIDTAGYITEISGQASIQSGTTFTTVTHGLPFTPNLKDFTITPLSLLGNASYSYPSNATSTTFRINLNVDPVTTNVTVAWGYTRK
jgi:hypothetical protein